MQGHGHTGHMQVAAELLAVSDLKDDFMHLGPPTAAGQREGLSDTLGITRVDQRCEIDQQPVFLRRLKRTVGHGIGLNHQVVLINHQQRQRNAGKQGLKALGSTFGHGLTVVEYLVLQLQLMLVVTELGDQGVQRVVVLGNDGAYLGGNAGVQTQR